MDADAQRLTDALAGAGASRTWLATAGVRSMVEVLSRHDGPLSHEVVDSLEEDGRREHLRALLVAAGALPAINADLSRFDRWSSRRLASLEESEDSQVIGTYVRWHLRSRLATLAERGELCSAHVSHGQHYTNVAIAYLAELRTGGRLLEDLDQADVDLLFAERPVFAASLRNFLAFAVSSRRCSRLRLPCYRAPRRELMSEECRQELVSRLAEDDSLALGDRVAGLLVLALAQPVARIVSLRTDAVGSVGGEVTIRLAKTPAPLPEQMGALVVELAERARRRTNPSLWLFPGRRAGEPLRQAVLTQRLRQLGVTCTGRRAALMALARHLPAPVLVDVLGYSRNFVAQVLSELRVDWSGYAALKARERRAS